MFYENYSMNLFYTNVLSKCSIQMFYPNVLWELFYEFILSKCSMKSFYEKQLNYLKCFKLSIDKKREEIVFLRNNRNASAFDLFELDSK